MVINAFIARYFVYDPYLLTRLLLATIVFTIVYDVIAVLHYCMKRLSTTIHIICIILLYILCTAPSTTTAAKLPYTISQQII